MSPATINLHLKLLGRMLKVARRWRVITESPDIGMLKQRKTEFDFLDFDEAEAFLAGAAEHMPEWYPYLVMALRTGMRVGELVALRWREDVDLDRGRIRVQQSFTTKTKGSPRPRTTRSESSHSRGTRSKRCGSSEAASAGSWCSHARMARCSATT